MRTELQNGYMLKLPNRAYEYEIIKLLGRGASCFVYLARYTEDGLKHEVILKEYNPKSLDFNRDESGALSVPVDCRAKFDMGLERFEQGYKKQADMRLNSNVTNSTTNIQGIHFANNTRYIEMTLSAGVSYRIDDQATDSTLYDFMRRMRSLTTVIGHYHESGYLHLDIKPDNIFAPNSNDGKDVILFDFDSMVELDAVANNAATISYTKEWAAIEQLNPAKRMSICKATDIFSVGEMIFYRIFGRHSNLSERRSYSSYAFDYMAPIFRDVNPKVLPLLNELLKKTLCNVVGSRYQTTEELIEKLDEIIKFADPQKPFLQTTHLSEKFFVGRDEELVQIENELQNTKKLYISGIGGIGKSELVEQYAKKHSSEYDAIIIATYTTDIKSMICNIPIVNVADQLPNETQDEYLNRKVSALQNIGEENKLFLIIDNYNTESNSNDDLDLFDKLTACAHKTVITTRNNISDERVINIKPIENARAIFDNYYKKPLSDNDSKIVDRIVAIYQNHTLATELLAKQMAAGRINPKDMLEKLNNGGLKNSGFEKIRVGNSKEHNAYSYIHTLFDISELSEDERYILLNLSLIPPTGISTEIFYKWCELSTYDNINSLVVSGWINHDEVYDTISLHPVVADIMLDELDKDVSLCTTLLSSITREKTKNHQMSLYDFFITTNYICQNVCNFKVIPASAIDFMYISSLAFYRFGKQETYITALNRAIESFDKNKDLVKVNFSQLHNALGILYKNDDRFNFAEKHYKMALSFAENQNFLISIYCNLINLYCSLEQYDSAEKIYVQSLDRCKEVYEEDNLHVATIYSLLGVIKQKRNNFKEAENYYKKALDIRIYCLGEISSDVAYSHNDLGALYHVWGRFAEAENEHNIALEIRLNLYGEKHKDTIISYTNIAVSLMEQNRFAEAEEKNNKALKLCYDVYGNNHSETAVVLNNIGFFYGAKKQYELSEKYFKQALHIWEKKFNGIHTKIADAKLNLGVSYREQNRFDEAIQMLLEAKDMYITIHKDKMHSSLANVYSALGKTYAMNENIEAAYDYYQNALSIRRKFFDEEHQKIKIIKERIEELKK